MKRLGIILVLMLLSGTLQAGNAADIEADNTKILKKHPNDVNAAYKVALARSWQPEKMDAATSDFRAFLIKHPNRKEAWIAYANLEAWCNRPQNALDILEQYKARFGCTKEYLAADARLLSSMGYYNQALNMNDTLLQVNPNDYDLVYTRAHALYKAHRFSEGRLELQKLQKIQPDNSDNKEIAKIFHALEESFLSVGANYYQDNQSIKNVMLPLTLDYVYNDNLHFIFKGLHEILVAGEGSGLETIDGSTTIYDNSFLAGFNWRFMPCVALAATAGDLKIDGLSNRFIYLLNLNFALNEKTNVDIFHWRNLYRPYLFPTSPKAVSLGIVEDLTSAKLILQPCFKSFINATVSYSTLSDDNTYTHVFVSPTKQFGLNSKLTLTLGANADFLSFSEQLHDGYYDPSLHQEYLAVVGLSYSPTCNLSTDISLGGGVHKDQRADGLKPAVSAYAGMAYAFAPFSLNVSADYTYRGCSPSSRSYQGFSAEAQLAVHF